MTQHIGASAFNLATGQVFKTKKSLIEQVKADPSKVVLTTTAWPAPTRQITADMVQPGECWNVVGPTPNDRRWYANVEAKGNPAKAVAK